MKKLLIGITGGIGTGKTTVCNIFEALSIPIYNADLRAKQLMIENESLVFSIKELLGNDAYDNEGKLNRTYISNKVFSDKSLLQKLNELVHPKVKEDTISWANSQKSAYVVKEAALLIESKSHLQMDYNILVSAPLEVRIKRVMERDNCTKEAVLARIKNQMPEEEKAKICDFIIKNDEKQMLIPQVKLLHEKLLKQTKF